VRSQPFPSWPKFDAREEQALLDTLKSGEWFRGGGKNVNRFEAEYSKATGSPHCLATSSGTTALITALHTLGVKPGQEVILPPYTFVACVNAILMLHAIPVFVDSDPETMQIDARKIEAAISDHTAAIMPVHLGGNLADLDTILPLAAKRKIPVLEDACQAHMGEWKGKKAGTHGAAGCFSFQASKNLNSGEGGAMLTGSAEVAEKAYAYHNNSRGRRASGYDFSYRGTGTNFRMTEFQAALLMAQMSRLDEQVKRRTENGAYLNKMLAEIPGILPAKMYPGATRNAYHLYMFRYMKEHFAGLDRAAFMKALNAEGVPCSGGYSPLNKEPFIEATLHEPVYKAIAGDRVANWTQRNACPRNDELCTEAVWFGQTVLLASRQDMEQIVEAVRKIHAHAAELKKA
jgi:dTDP-4-amino-4,6-dideoxygalactose transaminase